MRSGIGAAASELASYGRGPDNMLAHISSDEARFIDAMQGGRRTNPHTGLPEYGLFGKILKGIARAAGAVVGGMIAGPAGAAVGSGLATKLTGGSWKQALGAGAMGGIGGWAGNVASGAGGGLTTPLGMGGIGDVAVGTQSVVDPVVGSISGPAFSSGANGWLGAIGSAVPGGVGSVGAGLGALMGAGQDAAKNTPMPMPQDNFRIPQSNMAPRQYIPYTGDPNKYGEGPEHLYFDNVNPIKFKKGGKAPKGIATTLHQVSAPARIGALKGPGDGKSDSIVDAALSTDEHVLDANLVSTLGNGSSDAGHAVIEKWKAKVRAKSGMKNPHKPSKKIDAMKLMPRV